MINIIYRSPEEQGASHRTLKNRWVYLPDVFCSSSHGDVISIQFSMCIFMTTLIEYPKTSTVIDHLPDRNV